MTQIDIETSAARRVLLLAALLAAILRQGSACDELLLVASPPSARAAIEAGAQVVVGHHPHVTHGRKCTRAGLPSRVPALRGRPVGRVLHEVWSEQLVHNGQVMRVEPVLEPAAGDGLVLVGGHRGSSYVRSVRAAAVVCHTAPTRYTHAAALSSHALMTHDRPLPTLSQPDPPLSFQAARATPLRASAATV